MPDGPKWCEIFLILYRTPFSTELKVNKTDAVTVCLFSIFTIGKQRVLRLDIWPVPTIGSVIGSYNNERSGILIFCFVSNKKQSKKLVDGHLGGLVLQGTPVCRQRLLLVNSQCFQLCLNTCQPYFKVQSKITRDFEAQCSLFTYIEQIILNH